MEQEGSFHAAISCLRVPRITPVEMLLDKALGWWGGTVRTGTWGAGKKACGGRGRGGGPLSLLNQVQAPRAFPFVPRASPLQSHSVAPRSFLGEEGVEFFKGQMSNIGSRSSFAF